jgi:hypothetical protein
MHSTCFGNAIHVLKKLVTSARLDSILLESQKGAFGGHAIEDTLVAPPAGVVATRHDVRFETATPRMGTKKGASGRVSLQMAACTKAAS